MNYVKAVWNFLDGKKRGIAVIAGIVMAWAWKYQVLPEMWLDLGNSLLTAGGVVAVGHAAMKGQAK